MNIDDKLRWFTVAADGVIKDYGLKGKLIFVVSSVKNEKFPFRVLIEYRKKKYGFPLEAKVTLKQFERKLEEFLKDVKKNEGPSGSLFSL